MAVVRFTTTCDHPVLTTAGTVPCRRRAEEYSRHDECISCGGDICPAHSAVRVNDEDEGRVGQVVCQKCLHTEFNVEHTNAFEFRR